MKAISEEHIDQYLRGELSSEQLADFQSKMNADPSIKEAVDFQRTVQKGLSDFRKSQLKARLDALDVSPAWYVGVGEIASSGFVRIMGGVAVVSIIGLGIYYNLEDDQQTINASSESYLSAEFNHPIPKAEVQFDLHAYVESPPSVESTTEEPSAEVETTALAENTTAVALEISESIVMEEERNARESTTDDYALNVDVPELTDLEQEDGLKTLKAELPEIDDTDEISASSDFAVDVKTVQRRSDILKYKYFDGKLFLYGDFKTQPYEILEINRPTDRKIFVYFDESYYEVSVTDKVEEMIEITDARQIHELDILRNNKL